MDLRKAAVPALVLVGGALLAGCGDTATDGDLDTTSDPLMEDTMAPTP
ncbi:hypothetical protein [Demequina muriae]|uniref:Uncharacterized protein n=1 Tax=Demequina muriae TaxID=3051664 RepID=A0ABT8GE06_9MICO|nr:hypothetical protein [Demequina sp. EGI L300058]MDN4479663.1 hypothetical protein [Demequina sp. EGI L300058]